MTCRAAVSRTTPYAIGFPLEDGPVGHVPDFRHFDDTTGRVLCLRCGVMVTSGSWAAMTCPGPIPNPEPTVAAPEPDRAGPGALPAGVARGATTEAP